jgi:hypothetical protein
MAQLLIFTAINNNEELDILGLHKTIRVSDISRSNALEDLFTDEVEEITGDRAADVDWDFDLEFSDMKALVEVEMGFIFASTIDGGDNVMVAYNQGENVVIVGFVISTE